MFGGGPSPIEEVLEAENKEEVAKALLWEADTAILTARTIFTEVKEEKERIMKEHARLLMLGSRLCDAALVLVVVCTTTYILGHFCRSALSIPNETNRLEARTLSRATDSYSRGT
eukprot:scaffold97279_cov38-Tisochrysis_lutea.AAC.1